MANAIIGMGTLLKRGDGASPEVFTMIAEVVNITGPSFSRATVDVTNMDSANNYRDFMPGLLDGGEISFELNFIPSDTTQKSIYNTDMSSSTAVNYQIVFPDSGTTTWSFAGLVTSFDITNPMDEKVTANMTIKIVGQTTFA